MNKVVCSQLEMTEYIEQSVHLSFFVIIFLYEC